MIISIIYELHLCQLLWQPSCAGSAVVKVFLFFSQGRIFWAAFRDQLNIKKFIGVMCWDSISIFCFNFLFNIQDDNLEIILSSFFKGLEEIIMFLLEL